MTTSTGTQTLSEFLLARIAEDEAAARESASILLIIRTERCAVIGSDEYRTYMHFDRHGPARVLAECEAKRGIMEQHRLGGTYTPGDEAASGFDYCATCGSGEPYEYPTAWPCATLRLLALPYAEHPEYREEWRV